jgi:hypothetical protein
MHCYQKSRLLCHLNNAQPPNLGVSRELFANRPEGQAGEAGAEFARSVPSSWRRQ